MYMYASLAWWDIPLQRIGAGEKGTCRSCDDVATSLQDTRHNEELAGNADERVIDNI